MKVFCDCEGKMVDPAMCGFCLDVPETISDRDPNYKPVEPDPNAPEFDDTLPF